MKRKKKNKKKEKKKKKMMMMMMSKGRAGWSVITSACQCDHLLVPPEQAVKLTKE
jgi:hypothetical protein